MEWTREDLEQIDLVDVTWVGDRFVAVGADGNIAWTVDASSWTSVAPLPTPASLAAASNAEPW